MLCNAMHKKCKRDAAGRQLYSLPPYHSLSYTLLAAAIAAAIKYISATFLPSASRANMIKYCKCQKLCLLPHTNWDLLVGAGGSSREYKAARGAAGGARMQLQAIQANTPTPKCLFSQAAPQFLLPV